MKSNIKSALAALVLLAAAFPVAALAKDATPKTTTTISRDDAVALFNALSQVKQGLTSANLGTGAEDIYELKRVADAYQSAVVRHQIAEERAKSAKSYADALEAEEDRWDKWRRDTEEVKLLPLTQLSDQELKDGGVTMALLSPIQHFLYPKS